MSTERDAGPSSYPADAEKATVVIGAGINATKLVNAAVRITAPNRCEGVADGGSFCGFEADYKVYFAAEFDALATASGTWKDKAVQPASAAASGPNSEAYFPTSPSTWPRIRGRLFSL